MEHTLAAHLHRPLLRGWAHAVSFPVWVLFGAGLVAWARVPPSGRLVLTVYVVGTAVMFGVSALYHRVRWQPAAKALMQKLDRSAIFLAIAGGFTPLAWASLDGGWRVAALSLAWAGAVAGIVLHWIPRVPRAVKGGSYIVVSWAGVLVLPRVASVIGITGLVLILAGGVAYTVGAVCLATRRPDPWPSVFGFHEVFHAFTVVASALQFVAIGYAVVPHL